MFMSPINKINYIIYLYVWVHGRQNFGRAIVPTTTKLSKTCCVREILLPYYGLGVIVVKVPTHLRHSHNLF